jgi:GAF domain-containing protein/two-component sensor histidine kinase
MDTTIASPLTHGYELLAQLALLGHSSVSTADEAALTANVAQLLEQYLATPWGLLMTLDHEQVRSQAAWGLAAEDLDRLGVRVGAPPPLGDNGHPAHVVTAGLRLAIHYDQQHLGYLFLPAASEPSATGQAFAEALLAQIALLLWQRRQQEFDRRAEELRSLIGTHHDLIGQFDSTTLLRMVLAQLPPILPVRAVRLFVPREDARHFVLVTAFVADDLDLDPATPPPTILLARAVQLRSLQVERFGERATQLAMPLVAQDELVGVVLFQLSDQLVIDFADRLLFERFGSQMALLMRSALVFDQQRQRARELSVLFENSQTISATGQYEMMLARVTENIALALQAHYCAIYVVDNDQPARMRMVADHSERRAALLDNGQQDAQLVSSAAVFAGLSGDEPLLIESIASEQVAAMHPLGNVVLAHGCHSALLLALQSKDQPIGVVLIGFSQLTRQLSLPERNLARVLANQVGTAIVNRRLQSAEQRRASEMARLQEVSQHLNADLSLEDTLAAIANNVQQLLAADGVRIALYDAQQQELVVAFQRGLRERAPAARDGLLNWLAHNRRTLRLENVAESPLYRRSGAAVALALAAQAPVRSYIGMPLQVGDELIGTLEMVDRRSAAFSPNDERLVHIVAGQAAQALSNARRYEQTDEHLRNRINQLRALQRISSQLAITLYQDEIFEFVLEQALQATSASQALIALRTATAVFDESGEAAESVLRIYFPKGQSVLNVVREMQSDRTNDIDVPDALSDQMVIMEAAGFSEPAYNTLLQAPLDPRVGTARMALQRGQAALADDISVDEREALYAPNAQSALAAPIWYEASIVGVLMLLAPQQRAFNNDAVDFVRALAHQAAVAIGNSQRYNELEQVTKQLQRRASILNDVLEIGQALRADSSPTDILEQIGYSVADTTDYRAIIFSLVDEEHPGCFRVAAGAGIPLAEIERMSEQLIAAELVERYLADDFRIGRSFFVPAEVRIHGEEQFDALPLSYASFSEMREPDEWQPDDRLFVPLRSTAGRLIGLMTVTDPIDRQRPGARSTEVLEIFADQAAIAIQNYFLLRSAQSQAEQMTALYQVSAAVTAIVDLPLLLERIYQEIVAHLDVPSLFYIAGYLPESGQVRYDLVMRRGERVRDLDAPVVPKTGLNALIIDQAQPLLLRERDQAPPALCERLPLLDADIHSWAAVPLFSQSRVIGLLALQDEQPYAFSERDLTFLTALANQLAVAIDKAALFRERERRIAELDVINRVGRITSSTFDLQQMMQQVYECMVDFLPVDAFYIFVYRQETNEFVTSLKIDFDDVDYDTSIRRPARGSLTERIIETHQPLLFRDLRNQHLEAGLDPVRFGQTDRASASWLGVPLLVGDDRVVGVISLQSYTPDLYGEREKNFLTTVANQLALGVQNAMLIAQAQEQVQQLALLNQVSSTAAATLERDLVYQAIVESMLQATGADQARLVIYEREAGNALTVAQHGREDWPFQEPLSLRDNPAIDWIEEHLAPLLAADARYDPRLIADHERLRRMQIYAAAFVPLIVGGTVIGLVELNFVGRDGQFAPRTIELCRTIANQAATALVNSRLFAESQANERALQVKVGELSTLLDAARILSSLLRPDEVLDKLMELVSRQLAVTTVALWTIGSDSVLTPAAMAGIPTDMAQLMRVPIGQGFTGQVAQSGMPLVINDVEEMGGSLYPDFQRRNRLVSYMGVPVVYRERTIGVLSVMTNERREFSGDEMLLLVGLADQAATALDNARLFQERERRISELTTINHISAAVNAILQIDELLSELHRGIADIIDVRTSMIVIYDETFEQLRFPIVYDEGQAVHLEPMPLGAGINSWVVRQRQSLLIRNADAFANLDIDLQRERPGMPERPVQSCLAVPIIFSERVLGLINIQSYEAGAFDDNDLRFLTTVANQAAVAVNNAHLFSEVSQNAAEMKTLYDVTVALSGTLDTDLTQRLVAQAALQLINADICAVMLFDQQRRLTRQVFADRDGIRDDIQIPIRDNGLMAQTLRSEQPIAISDLAETGTANPAVRDLGVHGVISMAIGPSDERIGVIWVGSAWPHDWSSQQRSLLSILANQASQALQSAGLFQQVSNLATELEQRVADRTAALEEARSQILQEKERLEVVHAITLELTATLDLDEILSKALAMVSNHIGVARGSIMLKDTQTGAVVCRAVLEDAGKVRQASFAIRFDTGLGLVGWVMQHQEAACIADVHQDERWVLEAGRADDVISAAAVPLMTTDNTLGALILSSPQVNYFSESQMRLLETIASEVAIAINNAQLYNYITDIASQLAETLDRQREEASRSRAILQSVTEGVIVLDLERRITLFNPAAEQVLEIPAGEVLEQPVELLQEFGDDDAHRQRAALVYDGLSKGLEQVHDQGIYSLSLDLPEPTQIIAVNMAPVVSQDGRRYGDIAVLRDITREIEADRAKRQFISDVSHELRTPLTAIKGYIDVLLIGSAQTLSTEQIEYLNIVKTNANRLKVLIDDILDISRLDGGKIKLTFSEVAIDVIIKDVVQSLRLEAENKGMTIDVDIPGDLPTISADQKRLTQVVFNLFSNAVKYTFPGGTVMVRTHLNRGGMLQVDVEDTGVGMSTEQQKKLFRPFYRADNPLREVAGGTGLGLSIARSLVELHGGEMWVTSEIGKGSTFSFIIPPQQASALLSDGDDE